MSKGHNLRRVAARKRAPTPQDAGERIAALTGMARSSWIALLSYLAFTGVTLLGVQDADFFLVERETALPLIGVTIPTSLFFAVAPALGAMLYIQLHLYLVRLWKALDELPIDGGPGSERIRPWIVSDMALTRRPGAVHAYPLRGLANLVVWLFTFAAGPLVLAGFWWRSMPKHDEALTILACGLPLFAVIYAGAESWRALRVGGSQPRYVGWVTRTGWGTGLLALSVAGFLTTEGTLGHYARIDRVNVLGIERTFTSFFDRRVEAVRSDLAGLTEDQLNARFDGITAYPDPDDLTYLAERELEQRWWMRTWFPNLLRPAQLQGVVFVQTPPGWLPRDEAEQVFRKEWCADHGIPTLACGPGPLARHDAGDRLPPNPDLTYPRTTWCAEELGKNAEECTAYFAALDPLYRSTWAKARRDALAALPSRDLSHADLRRADLTGAELAAADLSWARLDGALVGGPILADERPIVANLEGAFLYGASLEQADLSGVYLQGANLGRAQLDSASFIGASLKSADLLSARLSSANLSVAILTDAFLLGAHLDEADLTSAVLFGANFQSAGLMGADLSGIHINAMTSLNGARLTGAAIRVRTH